MRPRLDLTGTRSGRLTALCDVGTDHNRNRLWMCRCDCGETKLVPAAQVRRGHTRSCGCLAVEAARTNGSKAGGIQNITHGRTGTPEYRNWTAMLRRVRGQIEGWRKRHYENVSVCDRWLSFEAFFEDMGRRPSPKHSIDRIDPDGNYEPGNCRWATPKEQANNRRPRRRSPQSGGKLAHATRRG